MPMDQRMAVAEPQMLASSGVDWVKHTATVVVPGALWFAPLAPARGRCASGPRGEGPNTC